MNLTDYQTGRKYAKFQAVAGMAEKTGFSFAESEQPCCGAPEYEVCADELETPLAVGDSFDGFKFLNREGEAQVVVLDNPVVLGTDLQADAKAIELAIKAAIEGHAVEVDSVFVEADGANLTIVNIGEVALTEVNLTVGGTQADVALTRKCEFLQVCEYQTSVATNTTTLVYNGVTETLPSDYSAADTAAATALEADVTTALANFGLTAYEIVVTENTVDGVLDLSILAAKGTELFQGEQPLTVCKCRGLYV